MVQTQRIVTVKSSKHPTVYRGFSTCSSGGQLPLLVNKLDIGDTGAVVFDSKCNDNEFVTSVCHAIMCPCDLCRLRSEGQCLISH